MSINDQLQSILDSLPGFLPEAALAVAFLLIILLDLLLAKRTNRDLTAHVLFGFTFLTWLVAGLIAWQQWDKPSGALFAGMLVVDKQAVFFKLLFTFTAIFTLLHAYSLRKDRAGKTFAGWKAEYFTLLTALLLGLYLMVMSAHLLLIYLAIEVVSLSSYLLTTFNADKKGAEGGIKYLLFGALSSGVMLYGMSLLYGFTGTLSLTDPTFLQRLSEVPTLPLLLAGILTISGLLFKISVVPFHLWTPDVYEGAPTPVVAFFSVAPKAAALVIFARLLAYFPDQWQPMVAGLSLGSMIIGNFSALWQTNTKRMLAYSSIAHAGFMLVGLTALNRFSTQSFVFYIATYAFINLAAFFLLDLLAYHSSESVGSDYYGMDRLKGLGLRRPLLGVTLLVVMLALTGLPPTAGFSAKLFIFSALWQAYQVSQKAWLLWLFIIGLLNAVVALFYYLKIPYLLFFRAENERHNPNSELSTLQTMLLVLLVVPVLLFFFKADWLMNIIAGIYESGH